MYWMKYGAVTIFEAREESTLTTCLGKIRVLHVLLVWGYIDGRRVFTGN